MSSLIRDGRTRCRLYMASHPWNCFLCWTVFLSHQTGRRILSFTFGQLLNSDSLKLCFFYFSFLISQQKTLIVVLNHSKRINSSLNSSIRFIHELRLPELICQILSLWFTLDRLLSDSLATESESSEFHFVYWIKLIVHSIIFWGIWAIDCNTLCESIVL